MAAIESVHEGMAVVDASGADIGAVEIVHTGDPAAVPGTEPDLWAEDSQVMLREGFLKLQTTGLLARNRYAAAGQIEQVHNGTVYLTVTADDLAKGRPKS